jgi:transcriptional regulator with XRE-family HTH domain
MATILQIIGEQLQRARRGRHLSQAALAVRLGRDRARSSGFERDLANNRLGRDRLTLFAETCDALDLVPVIVPRARAAELRGLIEAGNAGAPRPARASSAFDELFVDLGDGEEQG